MKVFIKRHPSHAGKWIYQGYANAWSYLGYDVVHYDSLSQIPTTSDYLIMGVDADFKDEYSKILSKSKKSFFYVQPESASMHWGSHPNFISLCQDKNSLNSNDKSFLWTFGDITDQNKERFKCWKHTYTLPLAYDSIAYKDLNEEENFDVCFIGGIADNGFNEKFKIMIDTFKSFEDSGLNLAFYINSNLSHEEENRILSCSKVALNIHDEYQRVLGADTNERTFKSLGVNGLLVSDSVTQLSRIFPSVETSNDYTKVVEIVKKYCLLPHRDRKEIKKRNKDDIIKNHTYVQRVKEMLSHV